MRKCRSLKIGEVSFLISTFHIAEKVNAEIPLRKRACIKIGMWKVGRWNRQLWKPKNPRIWIAEEGLTQQFGCQEGFKVPPCSEVHMFDLRGGKKYITKMGLALVLVSEQNKDYA